MELKEILKNIEVKNYKNGKTVDFGKLLKKADSGKTKAIYDAIQTIEFNGLVDDTPDDEMAQRILSYWKKLEKMKRYHFMRIFIGDAYARGSGVPADIGKAISWYKKAAKGGTPFGNECIGMVYFNGTGGIPVNYEKAYKYFTKDKCKKSFCTKYSLGEMYRKGLYGEKDKLKAWDFYSSIVTDTHFPGYELDDYYWRACYRLGQLNLDNAFELIGTAKRIYDSRGYNAVSTDITKEELELKWKTVKQTGKSYLKKQDRRMGSKQVCYIADFLPDLTKGKIYEVLDEDEDTYSVVDDENTGAYKYGRHCFKEV